MAAMELPFCQCRSISLTSHSPLSGHHKPAGGKGLGSKDRQPVLKGKVRKWLMQRDEVIAFCSARAADGGSGAVVVLLRATR